MRTKSSKYRRYSKVSPFDAKRSAVLSLLRPLGFVFHPPVLGTNDLPANSNGWVVASPPLREVKLSSVNSFASGLVGSKSYKQPSRSNFAYIDRLIMSSSFFSHKRLKLAFSLSFAYQSK